MASPITNWAVVLEVGAMLLGQASCDTVVFKTILLLAGQERACISHHAY